MVQFYGGGGGSSGGGSSAPTYSAPSPLLGNEVSLSADDDSLDDIGKTSIDLTNLGGSIGDAVGNVGGFLGGIVGGVAGAVGSVGIPGGPNIGDIPEAIGGAAGAIGSIQLPYAGNDPNRRAATLGDVPGFVGDVLSAPGRAIEGFVGGRRAEGVTALRERGFSLDEIKQATGIDEDLILAIEAGADPAVVSEEMVRRNAGFSSNPIENLAAGIVLDPMNFILPGVARAGHKIAEAGANVRHIDTVANLGMPARFAGTMYNAATRGLSSAGKATVGAVLGPATDGVFHAIGTKPVFAIRDGIGKISPAYADAFDDALARGAAQFGPAIIARHLADEAELAFKAGGDEALERFPRGTALGETVQTRLTAKKAIDPDALSHRVEEMAQRTIPNFNRVAPEVMRDETIRKMALITGGSPEDMLRGLGGRVTREQARATHLAFYGKAGSDLSQAKVAAAGAKNIDTERLTIIAPQTLTRERADEAIEVLQKGGEDEFNELIGRYDILARKFGPAGRNLANSDVIAYIRNLIRNDALPEAVKLPKSGKNPLPGPLGAWRQKYGEFGYEVGFGPKDGWKAWIDEATGEATISDPFVHFVDEALPLEHRNPLGRLVDGLTRGISQVKIIQSAKARMDERFAKLGLNEAETDAVFGKIIGEARERRVTPRGLGGQGGHEYDRLFKEALGEERFSAYLAAGGHPTFDVMRAFEGNLAEIGLTQKLTGKVKTAGAPFGNIPAGVAEGIYPLLRFKYRPVFQMQELIESPVWNRLRGAAPAKAVSDDAAKIMLEMANLGPEFRYTFEAGYVTHLAGGEVAGFLARQGPIGKALAKIYPQGGVQGFKERRRITQVFSEHGDYFKSALDRVNPRLFKEMAEAYGTTDARAIAGRFIEERFALASDPDAIRSFVGKAATADEETVMQAFLESWRQSMTQAFKTHYFNPQRGWLERTINHPYLGFYPASYMWGKVLPELARFLVRRPFGLDYPLGGAIAYSKVQEALVSEHTSPELREFIEANPDSIYFVQMMLPGLPNEIPVNAPAWLRHAIQETATGGEIDRRFIRDEVVDVATYATPARDALNLVDIADELSKHLERSAAEYDGMFGGQTPAATPRQQPVIRLPAP